MNAVLSVLTGVISSLLVVIFVEWMRQPRLVLDMPAAKDQRYEGMNTPAKILRCLRVRVRNNNLPPYLRWLSREAALNCVGEIRFFDANGNEIFPESMPARWTGSAEATAMHGIFFNNDKPIGELELWDSARLSIVSKIDIPAGEEEELDIAVRLDDDAMCFGWNNEAYRYRWRNPRWELPRGRFRVGVTIRSSGQKAKGRYLLLNDGGRDSFRLEQDRYSEEVGKTGYPPTILTAAERSEAGAAGFSSGGH